MKILILGISGRTGRLVAEEALKRGHTVAGITRDITSTVIPGAEITVGTPYDYDTVKKAIDGCDAVISTLNLFPVSQGLFSKPSQPLDVMSVAMRNTVRLMKEKGIRRIVLMTAMGVGDSSGQMPWFFALLVKISSIRFVYADHAVQEKVLEESGLEWTIVRPVALRDDNKDLAVMHNLNGNGRITSFISRNAVAHFMLDCIEKGEFIRQKPAISAMKG